MRQLATLLLAACLAAIAAATIGGDISSSVSKGTFDCCKKQGWDFVATRSYCSYGAPDPQAPANLDAAKAAGIATRDVYHFPCHGGDAAAQVKDDVDHVGKDRFGTLWFDIETNPSPNCGWSSDLASNCKFLGDMIDAGHKMGIKMGVYSSQYMWSSIMGSCTTGADHGLPLWYAHYDGSQSFSDFSPFGGWTSPYLKQYWDSVSYCGISADADWRP